MIPAMDGWGHRLREARTRVGLTRAELAQRSGVTASTIKSYETGARHASRPHLTAVLDALRLDRGERATIFQSAGFAPDSRSAASLPDAEMYSAEDAAAAIERYHWPAFVLDKFLGVVAANRMAQRLWNVDLATEFLDPLDRNLMIVATNPRFADRVTNWDEAVGYIVSAWKDQDWWSEELEKPGPLLAALMERFMKGDSGYVARLLELWQVPPVEWQQKMRWSYPVTWDEPGIGPLRFECLVGTASELQGLAFNDWIPVDAETWQRLEQIETRLR